jgi:hypothetical protein
VIGSGYLLSSHIRTAKTPENFNSARISVLHYQLRLGVNEYPAELKRFVDGSEKVVVCLDALALPCTPRLGVELLRATSIHSARPRLHVKDGSNHAFH